MLCSILIILLKLLMLNKMYISNTSKLLYSPLELSSHGKKLIKFPTSFLV